MLSRPGHVCSTATCTEGVWNAPLCVPSDTPPCRLDELEIPENATITNAACVSGWDLPHGAACELSQNGHPCTNSTCVAGQWGPVSCLIQPTATPTMLPTSPSYPGCHFADLQIPAGAIASGHENCRIDATGTVPSGSACMVSKLDHTCNAAACTAGTWSDTICAPSTEASCVLSDLMPPDGAQLTTTACLEGSRSPSGLVCDFTRPGHICSSSSCVAGIWSRPNCVALPGCHFNALKLPSGAVSTGENCQVDASHRVPSGGQCSVHKVSHTCDAAACMVDDTWSTVVCMPSSDPGCVLTDLLTPMGASIITELCQTGTEAPTGAVCEFEKEGHSCSRASCIAGTWSQGTCAVDVMPETAVPTAAPTVPEGENELESKEISAKEEVRAVEQAQEEVDEKSAEGKAKLKVLCANQYTTLASELPLVAGGE